MPLARLFLILAFAVTAAGLTLWVGLALQDTAEMPPVWMAMTGALALALIVRLLWRR